MVAHQLHFAAKYICTKNNIAAKVREAILKMRKISEANGNSEMTLDEINDEIQAARTQIR